MHRLFILILCVVGWPTILAAADSQILTATNNQCKMRGELDNWNCPQEQPSAEYFTGYQNRYAFIVGITRYNKFSSLDGPAYDAVAVANILAERYGFTVRLLIDDDKLDVTKTVQKRLVSDRVQIEKDTIIKELDDFQTDIKNPSESLLVFYYSGHGLRKVDGDSRSGFLVPGNGDEKKPETLLAFKELATKIAAYQAHHTLLVLDACFSGTIFEQASQVQGIFQQKLSQTAKLTRGNNVSERALARPVVQAITAGGGKELVADQANMSAEYMKIRREEADSLSNHSPFTALLIQSLSGRIGIGNQQGEHIPMGTIPGSMLGYEIRQALMDNSPLRNIDQTPQYQTLAGDGDILLMPVRDVLNPRLVGALYLQGEGYDSLRASGISALLTEAELITTSKGSEQKKQNLVREALPHFSYALEEPSTQVKEAALDALTKLVNNYNGPDEDFNEIIRLLTNLLNTSKTDILLKKAAILLGSQSLSQLADEAAIKAMEQYIAQRLLPKWKQLLSDSELTDKKLPDEVSSRENILNQFSDFSEQYPPTPNDNAEIRRQQAMISLESYRKAAQWLVSHGEQSILANKPIYSLEQFNLVFKNLQGSIGKLENQAQKTSSQLQQAQLEKLFVKLTEQLEELFDTYHKYYERYPEYKRFYRRYRDIDAVVSEVFELLPAWGSRFDYFNREVHDRAKKIEEYFKQRLNNEQIGDFSAKDWQKEFQEAIQFAEQKTLLMCSSLMLDKKADSNELSNELLTLLSDILNKWFELPPFKKDTWYYQSAHKILKEELGEGNKLRKKLIHKCNLWTVQGTLNLDWEMFYDNVVAGMKLVVEYRKLVKDMSPLIERLIKPKVEKFGQVVHEEILTDQKESERQIQAAKEEAESLKLAVEKTKSTLKQVEEQSKLLSKDLEVIQTQQQDEKQLLDAVRTSVEQIRDYFCRERGEDCSQ